MEAAYNADRWLHLPSKGEDTGGIQMWSELNSVQRPLMWKCETVALEIGRLLACCFLSSGHGLPHRKSRTCRSLSTRKRRILDCTKLTNRDASQLTRTVRNFDPSDVIDATELRKIRETSLILHLKMASRWPEIGLVQASHNRR
jgi:hypothetical protein